MNFRPPPDVRDVAGSYRANPTHFGQRIRALRDSLGLTLADLSRRSGIAAATLVEIEGRKDIPGLRMLERLCAGLGQPLARLLDDAGE